MELSNESAHVYVIYNNNRIPKLKKKLNAHRRTYYDIK